MNTVKDVLDRMLSELRHFETALRVLPNHNIADTVASAGRKLAQAADHADAATELEALEARRQAQIAEASADVTQEGFQFLGGNPAG